MTITYDKQTRLDELVGVTVRVISDPVRALPGPIVFITGTLNAMDTNVGRQYTVTRYDDGRLVASVCFEVGHVRDMGQLTIWLKR